MPVICWKTKKTDTTARARFTPGVHSRLRARLLGAPAFSIWSASAAPPPRRRRCPSLPSASLVSAYRPCWISHRGDSGIRARSATRDDRRDGADAEDDPPVRRPVAVPGRELEDQQRR